MNNNKTLAAEVIASTSSRDHRWWHFRPTLTPTALTLLTTLYFVVVLNAAFWRLVVSRLDAGLSGSPLLVAQMGVFLTGLTLLVLSLIRFPYILKPALAGLLVASAGAAYFMNQYGVLIDDDMLRNAMQTDSAETAGLLSWTLLGYLVVLGLLPAFVVMRTQVKWSKPLRNVGELAAVSALAVIMAVGGVFTDFKAAAPFIREQGKQMRWRAVPLNLVQASVKIARDNELTARPTPFQSIANRVELAPGTDQAPDNIVILVVGETARAMNFSLNGYPRETNPELSKLPVTSFKSVSSCGTATAISLPCMFSGLGRNNYSAKKVRNRENLLDLAKRAGYQVVWIDNQAGSKGVADRVEFQQLPPSTEPNTETSDADFVTAFKDILEQPPERLLLVMHQMGSHGPEYFKRSTPAAKHFLPECQDKQLERCSSQEIQNAYDNTIVQTDQVLAGLIRQAMTAARDRPISLLYMSDHGESLGENGLYLHGLPYALAPSEQTSVPMIYWANQAAKYFSGVSDACVDRLKDSAVSHDNYFDTVLGLLRIETDAYRPTRDLFDRCRKSSRHGDQHLWSQAEQNLQSSRQ